LRSVDIDQVKNPILYEIAWAYEFFVGCQSQIDNNFKKNQIFMNAGIFVPGPEVGQIDVNFFGKNFYVANKDKIRSLTYDDCFTNGLFNGIDKFRETGLPLTPSLWMKLQAALTLTKKTYLTSGTQGEGVAVGDFLKKFKKGSKPFRKIISKARSIGDKLADLTIVKSFANITTTVIPPDNIVSHCIGYWNRHFFDGHFRDFSFQCRHNILKTKDRISHFINVSESCVFGLSCFPPQTNRETFQHLFRTCPVVDALLFGLIRKCRLVWPGDNIVFNNIYWYGNLNETLCSSSHLFFEIFRYVIWMNRNRRITPSIDLVFQEIVSLLKVVTSISPKIREIMASTNNFNFILQAIG
jgi:hypothetical protein